jgi:membrane protease YdiL (CAAX protease family)
MKICPYCGKEYPDNATVCIIDRETLIDPNAPKESPVEQEPAPKPGPLKQDPNLVFPAYQWSARDAWKCIGILFCLWFIVLLVDHFLFLISPIFYRSGMGYAFRSLLRYTLELLTAVYFARTETLKTFWEGFGLDRKPTNYVWFGMVMALIIRCVGHFILIHKWGNGVHNYDLTLFRNTIGFQRFFFLFPLIIFAPLFEEPIYRGFLYKAFRGSYSVIPSTVLIIGWVCFTHRPQFAASWIAAIDLSALTIVQCYLREKSRSLWDCILCHFVFNASLLLS